MNAQRAGSLKFLPIIALFFVSISCIKGQSLKILCSFDGTNGASPNALTLGSDGNLYGTTLQGGISNMGTVFRVTTNGILTTLVSFTGTNGYSPSELTLGSDGNLYGTTYGGGSGGVGTFFRITNDGALTTLVGFTSGGGYNPAAALTLGNDGSFCGTTWNGGAFGQGTVFRITTNGLMSTMDSFRGSNGSHPQIPLTLGADGYFYSPTSLGGNANEGSIFKITPSGAITTLATLNGPNEGYNPIGPLTLAPDGSFYGTTTAGLDPNGWGTIFKFSGGSVSTLYVFYGTNGAQPYTKLAPWKTGAFYSTTTGNYFGTAIFSGFAPASLFQVSTNGVWPNLLTFPSSIYRVSALTIGGDGNFYGTTDSGGVVTNSGYPNGIGTVFTLIPSPIARIRPQVAEVSAGSGVTCSVTVSDYAAPLTYQWFFNDSPITGATGTSVTISDFNLSKAGAYWVTVSNAYGTDTKRSALRLSQSPVVLVDGVDVGGGSVGRVGSAQISMSSSFGSNAPIYFTVDGSNPNFLKNPYQGPFTVTSTTVIRAIAYDPAYLTSAESAPITVQILPTYQLLSLTTGGGSTSFSPAPYSGTNYFVDNTVVTVTATPSNGWSFLGWLGDATGENPNAQLTVTRDMAVEPVFGTSVISNVLGSGQISFGSLLPAYPYGTVLPVTAVPQPGSYLIGWAGALSGSNNPTTLVITNPSPVVTALFGPLSTLQYSLSVLPRGAGTVSITPYTNRFASGTVVMIKATADTNQTFIGWSGDATGLQNPLSVTMTQSKVITANFSSRPILSVSPPLNGLFEEGFRFSLTGELGATNRIDSSSNVSTWVSIGWITNEFGTSQFLDTSASTNAAQFYRAVQQ